MNRSFWLSLPVMLAYAHIDFLKTHHLIKFHGEDGGSIIDCRWRLSPLCCVQAVSLACVERRLLPINVAA